jgi:hypothetical protein
LISLRAVALAGASLFATSEAFGDDSVGVREIPVNVVLPDASLARNLQARQFIAKFKTEPLQILSVTTDSGPRRVVFVLDTAKENSKAARRIEAGVMSSILSRARSQDSFALITAHGARRKVPFGESREALRQAVEAIEQGPSGRNELSRVLDAIHEAVGWLQPSQPGDAAIVVAMGIEKPPGDSFAKIRDALNAAGVRLFGLQLGQPITLYIHSNVMRQAGGGLTFDTDLQANTQSLDALTAAAGGFTQLENTDSATKVLN